MGNSADAFASSTPSAKSTQGYATWFHIAPSDLGLARQWNPLFVALWFFNLFTTDLRHLANSAGLSNLAFYFIMAAVYLLTAFLPPARSMRKILMFYALAYVPFSLMIWHWILRRN